MGSNNGKSKQRPESHNMETWDLCSDFPLEGSTFNVLARLESLPLSLPSVVGEISGNSSFGSTIPDGVVGSPSESESSVLDTSFGTNNFRECHLISGSTTFGSTYTFPSAAFDESFRKHETNKNLLPKIEQKLKNHWFLKQNQLLEIVSSKVSLDQCPTATINDEEGNEIEFNLGEHRSVLLEGYLGAGKTIFARQKALNWAKNEHKFKLLFFLDPQNFTGTVLDALVEQAHVYYEDPHDIWLIIQSNEDSVFIIVDSYEYLNETASNGVKLLLESSLLPRAHILVTCNPRKSDEIKPFFEKNYEMSTFNDQQIQHFFTVFGDEIKTNVYQMLQVDCRDVLGCPLFLNILCVIAKTNPEHRVVHNITNLYRDFVSCIMSQKGFDLHFGPAFIEFGKLYCDVGSIATFSIGLINTLKHKKIVLELELLKQCDGDNNYAIKERNFTDFAVALYLETLIGTVDFETKLRAFLRGRRASELFLRFLIGLLAHRIDEIFHILPNRLTQNWNLDLINIFGEAGVFETNAKFALKMPNWIELGIHSAISVCERNGFLCLRPLAVVNTGSNFGSNLHVFPSTKIKNHLLSLFRMDFCPITRVDLDLTTLPNCEGGKCSGEFILDFLVGISFSDKIKSAKVKFCQISKFVCSVVSHLFEKMKHVEISFKSANGGQFIQLCNFLSKNLKIPIIESLEILTDQTMALPEIRKLCAVLKKCSNISSLKLNPVSGHIQIFDDILKINLKRLIINSRTIAIPNMKRNLSAGNLPRTADISTVLKMVAPARLECLNVAGLHTNDINLGNVFKIISISNLNYLRMADSFVFPKNQLCFLDLSHLVPPNKVWQFLDFSGWQFASLCADKSEFGSVRTLVAEKCECDNIFDIVDKLKVEKLVCDEDLLKGLNKCSLDANYCCNLNILKINCLSSCKSINISNLIPLLPKLSKLKFFHNIKKCANFWDEIKKMKNLKVLHLVCNELTKDAEKCIINTLQLDIDKIKLTLDVGQLKKEFKRFNVIFDRVKCNKCKIIEIRLNKAYNYNEFLNIFENWENEKDENTLSFKLVKTNDITGMCTIQLTL